MLTIQDTHPVVATEPVEPEVVTPLREAPNLPVVVPIDDNTLLQQVINEDVKHSNFVLKQLHQEWKNVVTVMDACKLALTTMKTLQMRRALLNKPLGAISQQQQGSSGQAFLSPYNQEQDYLT